MEKQSTNGEIAPPEVPEMERGILFNPPGVMEKFDVDKARHFAGARTSVEAAQEDRRRRASMIFNR